VVSLRHILDAQLRNQQPTLGQRFKLAYDLASAISSFGKIGWFHKGLSSSAIAFFYQQESSFEASSMDPYLIGFRHSRPHDIVTFTEGPSAADPDERYYQHPQYLQENVPYSFIHEYYSLGVVLLEIGLWKPVMKMTKLGDLVGDGLRTRIVETVVPRLGQSMGIVYRNVVLSLLDGNFGKEISNHDSDQKSARTWFDSTVLNELFQLSALKI
jgi:hypothetical protein